VGGTGVAGEGRLLPDGRSDNILIGGAGDDILFGSPGYDMVNGGIGDDVIHVAGERDWGTCGPGEDTLITPHGFIARRVDSCEHHVVVTVSPSAAEFVLATSHPGLLVGGLARARRASLGYTELRVTGTMRDDDLIGTDADEFFYASWGADRVRALGGADHVEGAAQDDWIDGGDGNDMLFGRTGDDVILGGSGDDRLEGGRGHDRLSGEDGADRLNGGIDPDVLDAGAGDDVVVAVGGGRDVIDCGPGADHVFRDRRDRVRNCEHSN
jgi:Ca2+-binding RTX toxin-like protein